VEASHADAANVHARTFANRLKTFEGHDVFGVVSFGFLTHDCDSVLAFVGVRVGLEFKPGRGRFNP
jgi:hypothetical protein